MKWFRMWVEARTDAKLRLLTDAEHRVWFQLLCYAAEPPDRGTINGVPRAVLAAECAKGKRVVLDRTIEKLVELRVLASPQPDKLVFEHFDKRQYQYPSERPEAATERKQRSRQVTRRHK